MTRYWVKVRDHHGRISDHSFDSEVGRTLFIFKCEEYGGAIMEEWESL